MVRATRAAAAAAAATSPPPSAAGNSNGSAMNRETRKSGPQSQNEAQETIRDAVRGHNSTEVAGDGRRETRSTRQKAGTLSPPGGGSATVVEADKATAAEADKADALKASEMDVLDEGSGLEQQFKLGDLVLAKVASYPPWPAMVSVGPLKAFHPFVALSINLLKDAS